MRDLVIVKRRVDSLLPYDRNARTHTEKQVDEVAASMREYGWTNPILIRPDGGIIAGHARLRAALKLGYAEVPTITIDGLSETQIRALILADNKLALNAGWDDEMLRSELAALKSENYDLEVTGFDADELDALIGGTEGNTDPEAIPAAPAVPVTRLGDLWLLGSHRLMCGDATKLADVQQLMGGRGAPGADLVFTDPLSTQQNSAEPGADLDVEIEAADLVFTDPPYNVDYTGYTADQLTIKNDKMSAPAFRAFLTDVFKNYRKAVKAGASLYVCHASSCQREFQDAIEAAGFTVRCQIIWAKNTFAWGFGRYKFQHEPIFYCYVKGKSDPWYGDKSQSTLWHEKKPAANRLHPTMKPVELVERALLNSSKSGDVVLDFFGGSGSTLIACERRGRLGRTMELDPVYADVILTRWQDFTGKPAVLASDGREFREVADERRPQ